MEVKFDVGQKIQHYLKDSKLKNLVSPKINLDYSTKDSLELEKEDKSKNGKFDVSECIKNFGKGLLSPITAAIKHPVMTIGMVAATAALCTAIPVMGPIMAVGFGALSAVQLGKGIYNVAKNYKVKEYDKAETSFNEVGQGTIGVVLTALGLKQGAKVAKEAKLMNELGTSSLDAAQREVIALEVKNGSKLDAIKEIGSLFTTKNGIKATVSQFKPSNMASRIKDAIKSISSIKKATKIKKKAAKFTETPEGQRRAMLSSEEIESEINALYNEAFEESGIPKELRPKIEIVKEDVKRGGGYCPSEHKITINENAYREGVFDLPDVTAHEATHAREAILRQRLPMEEKEKLAVQYFLDKIQNGEKENILTGKANFLTGAETMKPPKLNAQMKADFAKLAQDKLYSTNSYSESELAAMVEPLVKSNPEFINGYDSVDDAVNAMAKYAGSHNSRYNIAINNSAGFNTKGIDASLLKELSEEEKIAAMKSFVEGVDCLESNAAGNSGFLGFGGDFNQYQFTPEEVLAQQKGNNFEIAKLESRLKALRANENYDLSEEAMLLDKIKKSKLIIEYKTKGQEMYKLYTESLNNPQNKELAEQVLKMQQELKGIDNEIKSIDCLCSESLFGTNPYVRTNNYIKYNTLTHDPLGAGIYIPYTTTNTADIIADEIK